MQTKTSLHLKGIDISHWNGVIDFNAVKKDGIDFVYIKATEGIDFTDPMFQHNVKGAREEGIYIGAYHYANPSSPFDTSEPYKEAEFFVNIMKIYMPDFGDIMPVLDLEEPTQPGILTPDQLVSWTWIFHDRVKELTNRQVMLYTGTWFIQQNDDFGYKLSDLPLWIAEYEKYGITQPSDCGGWDEWLVWQYSEDGKVNGISGKVDLNAGATSIEQLRGCI
ncbi:glycoside hydrolase family 25 protein [Aneurinibacillus aneurinilyticus]|nr:glycoside hydrolase family 25 protein [Aneurinibacillus aneurinilyticus]MCI1696568.1 glycoside hydrolase family 25 protein [Aneurinibacillus aneurinilyticus]MED0709349.1 glycoside hydrolase family 25 protein [Aneurinibacillus aneurinilyticus]MED0723956.1 glycoside hydrolase family 25 protein [Aneurinibacillus aneurinilyticus]MED0735065.1 glycoside hydrolase family 25 protein [Aneurinibacillus aneurinilyticus]MED0743556.1 glycoside hydrolase family 25 protein [Aneurinibacillus aneurinilyticu